MVKERQIKKDILKITLLLLIFSVSFNLTYAQKYRLDEIRSRYFGYINFKRAHITLPDTILSLPLQEINTENSFIEGMFFNKKQKLEDMSDSLWHKLFILKENEWIGKQKIPENFVNLLCDNDMVSIAWDYGTGYRAPCFYNIKDNIVQDFKDWNEFWFLGKIPINQNFDSYLVFIREKDTSGLVFDRFLFLMNVKDNVVISLTQVAYTVILGGEGPYFFTKAASRGRYCYYGIYYSTCHTVNRFGKYINEPIIEKYTYFTFDKDGYVKVLELKGRKKFIIYKHKYKLFENVR